MSKTITSSQLLGEIGESSVRTRFLKLGFQFDCRSRLEAGIDGIAEVMNNGQPLGRMIAVQVKATHDSKYTSEDAEGFTYLLRQNDLEYWQNSNIPVILVLYRQSDNSYYWQEVQSGVGKNKRRIRFSKTSDVLNQNSVDRLAALTVPKNGQGYYVPPLGGGEEALVNILPINLPREIFVSTTPYSARKAFSILFDLDEAPRFDWIIKGGSFWSFHDPRESCCNEIVDIDQVEAIETEHLAMHEDVDEQNSFAFLLRNTLRHQTQEDLNWNKNNKLFYFRAFEKNQPRNFHYKASKKKTATAIVNVAYDKKDTERVSFVRHHAFIPRFEKILNQWFLVVSPTYHFTTNGFQPHSYPDALLSGKKRLDNNASIRGQIIMWHRFLSEGTSKESDLFRQTDPVQKHLTFEAPPVVSLPTTVPEDAWNTSQSKTKKEDNQAELELHEI